MPIAITRVGTHVLKRADGSTVSTHVDIKEAYEKASALPAGVYTIVTADERVTVTVGAGQPPVTPPVVPPVIPPVVPPVVPPVTPPVTIPSAPSSTVGASGTSANDLSSI